MHLFIASMLLLLAPVQRPADIVKWTAQPSAKPVAGGGVARIELTAAIEPGWKLYALTQPKGGPVPLSIAVAKGTPFAIDRKQLSGPKPKIQNDEQFSKETQYHENAATFVVPVLVPKSAAPGVQQVPLEVTFQACGQTLCLRPFTQRVDVALNVAK